MTMMMVCTLCGSDGCVSARWCTPCKFFHSSKNQVSLTLFKVITDVTAKHSIMDFIWCCIYVTNITNGFTTNRKPKWRIPLGSCHTWPWPEGQNLVLLTWSSLSNGAIAGGRRYLWKMQCQYHPKVSSTTSKRVQHTSAELGGLWMSCLQKQAA